MKEREALKLALEALEDFDSLHGDKTQEAITAIKAALEAHKALAQPEQFKPLTDEQKSILNFLLGADDFEGVWYGDKHPHKKGAFWWRDELRKAFQPSTKENGPTGQNGAVITSVKPDVTWKLNELYTTPPQRTWVGLTDVEISNVIAYTTAGDQPYSHRIARAIEAKLKEKNT